MKIITEMKNIKLFEEWTSEDYEMTSEENIEVEETPEEEVEIEETPEEEIEVEEEIPAEEE